MHIEHSGIARKGLLKRGMRVVIRIITVRRVVRDGAVDEGVAESYERVHAQNCQNIYWAFTQSYHIRP